MGQLDESFRQRRTASFVAHTFRKLIANNLDIKERTLRMMTRAPFICLLFVSTVSANLLGGLGWSWPASLPNLANLTTWQPGNLADLAPVPFFPDFSAWIPNFFAPTSGLTLDVLENNNHGGLILNLDWSAQNMTFGQGVVVSCNGRTG